MNRLLRLDRLDLVSLGLLGGAGALTSALWARLPARVPTHFDLHGQANAWMPKSYGSTLLLGTGFAVWALVRFGGALLPRAWRERLEGSPVSAAAAFPLAFLVALQVLVLWAALHPGEAIGTALAVAFAIFWLVFAQIVPRIRRNPFLGVRTAWTLSSDENWARTHRFASISFTVGAIVAIVLALASVPAASIVAVIASAIAPAVYSFVVAHRLPPEA